MNDMTKKETDMELTEAQQAAEVFKLEPRATKIKKQKQLKNNTKYRYSDKSVLGLGIHTINEPTPIILPPFGKIILERGCRVSITKPGVVLFSNNPPTVPVRVTDDQNNILGYPVLSDGKVTLSDTPPSEDIFHSSYLRDFAIHEKMGAGSFGTVKKAIPNASSNIDDVCLKSIKINHKAEIAKINAEFNILQDLNQTAGQMTVQTSQIGLKAILPLKNLGKPLNQSYATTIEGKITQSINVLLAVDRLHTGEDSQTKTPYAHRDIKPENILIDDKNGNLSLIDFGFAITDLKSHNAPLAGTLLYLPISYTPDLRYPTINNTALLSLSKISPVDSDKIAALRTIYHPLLKSKDPQTQFEVNLPPPICIFTQEDFNQFPPPLQKLLNTHQVGPFVGEKNKAVSEKMIASVLAYYQLTNHITEQEIISIKQTPDLQTTILNAFEIKDLSQKETAITALKEHIKTIEAPEPMPSSETILKVNTNYLLGATEQNMPNGPYTIKKANNINIQDIGKVTLPLQCKFEILDTQLGKAIFFIENPPKMSITASPEATHNQATIKIPPPPLTEIAITSPKRNTPTSTDEGSTPPTSPSPVDKTPSEQNKETLEALEVSILNILKTQITTKSGIDLKLLEDLTFIRHALLHPGTITTDQTQTMKEKLQQIINTPKEDNPTPTPALTTHRR